jgi:nucleolar protein 15
MGKFAKTSRKHLRKPTPYEPKKVLDKKQSEAEERKAANNNNNNKNNNKNKNAVSTAPNKISLESTTTTTKQKAKADKKKLNKSNAANPFEDDVSEDEMQVSNTTTTTTRSGGKAQPSPRGVIYVGRLPFGFYEKALRGFFSQFGAITRLRVARSMKVFFMSCHVVIDVL